ncbi:MAG: 4Fe-4S ferredoxin [Thermoplasmata archaeon]|nr:MAG: 4Fe-4S ferredoxin [Thermoplasmata archaeon]
MSSEAKIIKLLRDHSLALPRGRVYVIEDRCKGCGLCIEFCPKKVLHQSERFNAKGYHPPELIEEPPLKVCIACKFCEMICPDFAIFVEEVSAEEVGGMEEGAECTNGGG